MAISVKDIQEKEFTTIADNAYDALQVDDFLDELAAQVGAMTSENQALSSQVKELEAALAAAKAENVAMEKAESDRLHAVVEAYRANFQKLLDEQVAALKAGEALLK